jgi:hypothetical protein
MNVFGEDKGLHPANDLNRQLKPSPAVPLTATRASKLIRHITISFPFRVVRPA